MEFLDIIVVNVTKLYYIFPFVCHYGQAPSFDKIVSFSHFSLTFSNKIESNASAMLTTLSKMTYCKVYLCDLL